MDDRSDSGAGAARHNPEARNVDAPQPSSTDLDVPQPESPSVSGFPKIARPRRAAQTPRRGKSKRAQKRPDMLVVDDEPVLLTRAQAARLAQVSVSKLDQWSRQPGCPVIRQGNHFVRFPREKFIVWLAELDTQPG